MSVPEPVLHVEAPIRDPSGNWLARAVTALFVEGRLPYRVAQAIDKAAVPLGLRYKTVRANGLKFRIRRRTSDELIVQNIVVNHDYTPSGFAIEHADTIIDIGANIGVFSLVAAQAARKGRVFAFEPSGENFEMLERNLRLNGEVSVVPVHAAVGAGKGQIKLFLSEGSLHSILEDRMVSPDSYELVDCIGLKDVFDQYEITRCHFLKLDCEGAEYDILYNLPADYFARIDKIVMEYHGDKDRAKRRIQSDGLVAHLQNAGFLIAQYIEYRPPFRGGWIRATRG